ncbi:Omp28-related outer membrane protein [Flavobacteriales bacterium]|nr:Omp28-related outer membrane protein [Flavobacteriales bacterium]
MKKIIFILALLSAFSCDYIDEPLTTVEGGVDATKCPEPTFAPNTNTKRNILVEDFTGQLCTFCTTGAYILDTINKNIGSQIIPMGIHSGSFGVPEATGNYTTDFRTPGGSATYDRFAPGAPQPTFMVARIDTFISPARFNIGYFPLSKSIRSLLNSVPTVNLQLKTSYDPADGTVCVYSESEVLQTLTDDHSLVVVLLEDSIVGWQKHSGFGGDPIYGSPSEIPNYVQKHVVRKYINGWEGTKILSSSDDIGDKIVNGFTYKVTEPSWRGNHLEVVAFIYNNNTKVVMQAAKDKL